MNELNIKQEKTILQKEIDSWFKKMQGHLDKRPSKFKEQVQHLALIRKDNSEDLNQLQHKALIIEAAEELQKNFPEINRWTWHPKQTSHVDFADLTGFVGNKVFLNAEATTSENPEGTTAKRMHKTLSSLNNKNGLKFYFVQTLKMLQRAKHKIENNGFKIDARHI